jgi:sec-independent protein translocase protein TatA
MLQGLFRPLHLVVILVIALLVFGPKRLPELGKSLGSGIRSFKRAFGGRDDHSVKPEK